MGKITVLQLEDGENLQSTLFRLEKGWTLRFTLGTSLQPLDVEVFTNYCSSGKPFSRTTYNRLNWCQENKCRSDDGDRYADINLKIAGAFHFYLSSKSTHARKSEGYFLVQPTLNVAKNCISLDGITMQTVLAKSLGPFREWRSRLQVAKESGYNCIHFTPIQELGESISSYSIKDQLKFNHNFSSDGKNVPTSKDIASFMKGLSTDWGMISIVDVVWNHTANNTDWIQEHPEGAYNLVNSPHLRPAYLVDRALWHLNAGIGNGLVEGNGIPPSLTSEEHLSALSLHLGSELLPALSLEEFYIVDVKKVVSEFRKEISGAVSQQQQHLQSLSISPNDDEVDLLKILQCKSYKRLGCSVDMRAAMKLYNKHKENATSEEQRVEWCCAELSYDLEKLNEEKMAEVKDLHDSIVHNVMGHVRYHFLDEHGPKYGIVTEHNAILTRYFMCPLETSSVKEDEQLMDSLNADHIFAHQGWVMGGDALKDFASPESLVYIRRELIAWGDSIKLRYGDKPSDAPVLWKRMKEYTNLMARIFNGFRLDNCHATPIHVAEYLLDAAREVNPDLYVVAELFTNSAGVDNTFVNRLGINSLIRERMSAHNSHELGRIVYLYGGMSVGSFMKPAVSRLQHSVSHALLMDLTHDNRSPCEVRSIYDYLPSAALVAIANCAIGSNRGYDEFVPHHISVVREERLYAKWKVSKGKGGVSNETGMVKEKRFLNELHQKLEREGYDQIYVDQVNENVVSVTRHCPKTHESIILVAHTAFSQPETAVRENDMYYGQVPNLVVPGVLEEIVFEAQTLKTGDQEFLKDKDCINGLTNYTIKSQQHVSVAKSFVCGDVVQQQFSADAGEPAQEICFQRLTPGSVVVFKVSPQPKPAKALQMLKCSLSMFPEQGYALATEPKGSCPVLPIDPIVEDLTLSDLNRILFRCDPEGRDDGHGVGVYVIPDVGELAFCGLQGFISMLTQVHNSNDLGHPLCDNLRKGPWMPDYISSRLTHYHGTRTVGL